MLKYDMMRSPSGRTALNNIIAEGGGVGRGQAYKTYTGMCLLRGHDFAITDLERGICIGDMFWKAV